MASIYGHKWVSAHGTSPDEFDAAGKPTGALTTAGDTWLRGLRGVSERQIATGLAACLDGDLEWPPSLPRFKAMCLGIPSLASVRVDIAKRGKPFIRQVWRYLDAFRFARANADKADSMLAQAYELAKAHVMAGGELPPEPVAEIEHQPEQGTPASEATAMANIEAILAELAR